MTNRERAVELRQKGWTHTEISEELGISRQRVAQYFCGPDGRYFKPIKSCYPNLERWLWDNGISITHLCYMMGLVYNPGTSALIKNKLQGGGMKKSDIDKLLEITGMSYEVCFAKGEANEIE